MSAVLRRSNDADTRAGGDRGYSRQLEPASSDYGSTRISDGYTRHFNPDSDDDVSAITELQLRPGNFGGIAQRRPKRFGQGPSSLLTGDACLTTNEAEDLKNSIARSRGVDSNNDNNRYARHLSLLSDDNDGQSRGADSQNAGYARRLSIQSDDNDENPDDFGHRSGRFGGISERYQKVYGRGPDTFLTGKHNFLTDSIATGDIETNKRDGGVGSEGAAAAERSKGSGVLAAIRNLRRPRFNRQQAPRADQVEMKRPEWPRGMEPNDSKGESSVHNEDNDSDEKKSTCDQLLLSSVV